MTPEVNLGPGAFPSVVEATDRTGARRELLVLSWVLDQDGTGCAVVMLPNGTCARLDRLTRDGWTDPTVVLLRPQTASPLITP